MTKELSVFPLTNGELTLLDDERVLVAIHDKIGVDHLSLESLQAAALQFTKAMRDHKSAEFAKTVTGQFRAKMAAGRMDAINIFDLHHVDAIVIPVNCVGVPGAGLAKEAAKRRPLSMANYVINGKGGLYQPGHAYHVSPTSRANRTSTLPCVIIATTKDHWRAPSQLEWIRTCVQDIRSLCETADLLSVAIPPLGCGLGGLDYAVVKPVIVDGFSGSPVELVLTQMSE